MTKPTSRNAPAEPAGLDSSILQYSVADEYYYAAKSFPDIYACVREGDVERITQQLQNENYTGYQRTVLNRISFSDTVSLLCGVLIMCGRLGGLPLERCVMLASKYVKKSSEVDQYGDLVEFLVRLHIEFTQEVHQYRIEDTDLIITQCRNYIYSNIQMKIDLEELAIFCGYSLNGLQHYFKRKTGVTLTQYIRQEKIRRAQFLLRTSDESCAVISQKLSFCSQSHFINQFKRETDLTPYQFRKQRQ